MEVKKPTFEDRRKKRKLGMGIILSQNIGYELNDCTYNFLIDHMSLKNDFGGPSKRCFVREIIQRVSLCFSSERSGSDSQSPLRNILED